MSKNSKVHLHLEKQLYDEVRKQSERLGLSINKLCEVCLSTTLNDIIPMEKENIILAFTNLGQRVVIK